MPIDVGPSVERVCDRAVLDRPALPVLSRSVLNGETPDRSSGFLGSPLQRTVTMRKLAGPSLVVALFGLALALAPMGCSDDAGGNEVGVMDKTEGGKGTVEADYPKTQEDYYKQNQPKQRKK
jgi:hypothetical protein